MNRTTAACNAAGAKRKRRARLGALVLLCTAAYAVAAEAGGSEQEAWPQVWLNPGIYSHHFDSGKGLRNNNIGFGGEVHAGQTITC